MFCFMAIFRIAMGQDIHFSQADLNPLFVNPAYTGFFEGRARFSAFYRNQWATVSNPYQTLAASAEVGIIRNRYSNSGLNLGVMVSADKAGSLGYDIAQADMTLSFFKALSYDNENYISAGITGGYGQRGFNPQNAEMTDPSEAFDITNRAYFDVGAGIMWSDQFTDQFGIQTGIAAYHLNKPNISYLGLDDTYLEPKFNFYLNFSIATSDRLVRTLVQQAEVPLEDAVRMASETPAHIMGVFGRKGALARGKDADVLVLDDKLKVRCVWQMGRIIENTLFK